MSKWAGPEEPGKDANFTFTNDLDRLSIVLVIDSIRIFWNPEGLTGISILYTNMTKSHAWVPTGKAEQPIRSAWEDSLGYPIFRNCNRLKRS